MKCRVLVQWAAVVAAAMAAAACGSGSPTSASGGGVAVQGVVLSNSASLGSVSAADTHSAASQARKVTVKIDGTSMTVDVSSSGTFQFTGVPGGTFTLVFLADGVEIGRVMVTAGDGSEVKIVVQVNTTEVVVVQLTVDDHEGSSSTQTSSCPLNGGTVGQSIELEGSVASGTYPTFKMTVTGRASFPIDVDASGASVTCIGSAKTTSDCKQSIKSPAKVHVSGTLKSCGAQSALVTASEVKVQKD